MNMEFNSIEASNENGKEKAMQNKSSKFKFGVRHIEAIFLFGGLVFGYFLRVNMSVAIVAMTKENSNFAHFHWSKDIRHLILSSFFWGYVVAQVPSGLLAQRFGPKTVFTIATALCGIITIALPVISKEGDWQSVIAVRVFVGLLQGVLYPCVHTLLARWVPKPERGILSSFIYSGAQLGTVIMLAVSGPITESSVGWPGIYYFSGGIAFFWSILYYFCGSESPRESNYISKEELFYIEENTGTTTNKDMKVPWKSLFTSKPFYGLIFAHCGYTWGFYTLLTEIPTYLSEVLQLNFNESSLLSALPYFTMWIISLIISPISDVLINNKTITVEFGRKLFNSIGQWVPMICLIGLSYMTKDNIEWAITFLTIAVGFNASCFVGYMVNHMDLSPNFSGPMMGITNGLSNLLSIFAPIMVSWVVDDETDPGQWRIVFFITAGFYLVCNSIFIFIGKAEIQPWNEPAPNSKNIMNTQIDKDISYNKKESNTRL